MRNRVLGTLLLSLALAGCAGCAGYGEVRSLVSSVAPEDAERIGECQEFGLYGFIEEPTYGCAYFVRGTRGGIAAGIVRRLDHEGFESRCRDDRLDGTIELQAKRGTMFVDGRVSRRGSVITMSGDQPLNIHSDTRFLLSDFRAAPPAHVIVKLSAGRYDTRPLPGHWRDCVEFLRDTR